MRSHDIVPTPPRFFAVEDPAQYVRSSADTFGQDLLIDEIETLNQQFEIADLEESSAFLRGLCERFHIDPLDYSGMFLNQVMKKYDFDVVTAQFITAWLEAVEDGDDQPTTLEAVVQEAANAPWSVAVDSATDKEGDFVESVESTRSKFAALVKSPINRKYLDSYFDDPETGVPTFFVQHKDQYVETHLLADRVTSDDPSTASERELPSDASEAEPSDNLTAESWSYWLAVGASDEQFVNFLQWHNARMYALNHDERIINEIDLQKTEYANILSRFHGLGQIRRPKDTMEKLEKVQVYIGDIFTTYMQDRSGYCQYDDEGNDYIVVAESDIADTTMHEFNHAALGSFRDRWLDEATTEHLLIGFKRRRLRPIKKFIEHGVYQEERELLHIVMNFGASSISEQTLYDGYTQTTNGGKKDVFEYAVERAWCANALVLIQDAIANHEKTLTGEGHSQLDAQKKALQIVRSDLLQQPHEIFGKDFRPSAKAERALVSA